MSDFVAVLVKRFKQTAYQRLMLVILIASGLVAFYYGLVNSNKLLGFFGILLAVVSIIMLVVSLNRNDGSFNRLTHYDN